MSQQSTELSAPVPHSLETFNSLSSWSSFPGSQEGWWLWQDGSFCTHPSKDTLPERGGLGENDLERTEISDLQDRSWCLAVESGFGCSLGHGMIFRICGVWADCSAGVCGLPLLLAQFWDKTDAAQRAQPRKRLEVGMKAAPKAVPSCCLTLLLVPALHFQASEGCRKDRKVSLASI